MWQGKNSNIFSRYFIIFVSLIEGKILAEVNKLSNISNLLLNSRKSLNVTGVKDVDKFDDKEVVAITNQGKLRILGNNLKIGKFSAEAGTLELSGRVSSLVYVDYSITKGFFRNLFK